MLNNADSFILNGPLASRGYDSWWHSFTGKDAETGEERSFFIEFYFCNPELGSDKVILGQPRKHKKGVKPLPVKPSYLMVKAGCWGEGGVQLHRFFPWSKVEINEGRFFYFSAGDCFVSRDATCGRVKVIEDEAKGHPEWMSGAGEIEWRLVMERRLSGNRTLFKGQVRWNGRLFNVSAQRSFGYASRQWGSEFLSPAILLSSCDLKSRKTGKFLNNSAFAIEVGNASRITLKERVFEFNGRKNSLLSKTSYSCRETKSTVVWHIEQRSLFNRMVADITCLKREMILMNRESPDGIIVHRRFWNGGNGKGTLKLYRFGSLVDEISVRHALCKYGKQ